MNEVNEHPGAPHLLVGRQESNAGAMFCKLAKPRGAASKNFAPAKFYAEQIPALLRQDYGGQSREHH
jgi:hypothetical protein